MKRENDSSSILKNPFVDQGMLEGREMVGEMAKNETPNKVSREEILAEFKEMGVMENVFSSVPTSTLARLLENIKGAANDQRYAKPRSTLDNPPILSTVDKKILKALLSSTGGVSSLTLSKELDIPLSTVQRRRKRLEANLLEMSYTLKVERFGWRTATLFISTRNGMTAAVGKEILSLSDGVKSVNRILGENSADLMVEIIFRNNSELLNMVEKMKSINGVGNVFWIELIEPMGKNTDFCERVIEAD
jgi:DNA-binding Lrp family transcriptional regulator